MTLSLSQAVWLKKPIPAGPGHNLLQTALCSPCLQQHSATHVLPFGLGPPLIELRAEGCGRVSCSQRWGVSPKQAELWPWGCCIAALLSIPLNPHRVLGVSEGFPGAVAVDHLTACLLLWKESILLLCAVQAASLQGIKIILKKKERFGEKI